MSHVISSSEGAIFGLGNPLLDLVAEVDESFLLKYDIQKDNAILADEKHKNMVPDLISKYEVEYVAGGSVQNTMRIAEWLLGFKV